MDAADSTDRLAEALSVLARARTTAGLQDRIRQLAGSALDPADISLLFHIRELGPVRVTELAAAGHRDHTQTSRRVSGLEARGLVTRHPDQQDRRVSRIMLGALAVEQLHALADARRAAFDEVLAGWDPIERVQLAHLLDRFAGQLLAYGRHLSAPQLEGQGGLS